MSTKVKKSSVEKIKGEGEKESYSNFLNIAKYKNIIDFWKIG